MSSSLNQLLKFTKVPKELCKEFVVTDITNRGRYLLDFYQSGAKIVLGIFPLNLLSLWRLPKTLNKF